MVDVEDFGAISQKELKEGGKDLNVTEENKMEFGKPTPGNYRSKRPGAKVPVGAAVELKAKFTLVDRKIAQLTAVRGSKRP